MKGSARAGSVIAAPVNAEQRLLKVCASVAEKKYVLFFHITWLFFIADVIEAGSDSYFFSYFLKNEFRNVNLVINE